MRFAGGALLSLLLLVGAGCADTKLPVLVPATQQSCGNPCASMNCPTAFRCSVDAHCGAHCDPERVGDRPL